MSRSGGPRLLRSERVPAEIEGAPPRRPARRARRLIPWLLLSAVVCAVVAIVGASLAFPQQRIAEPITESVTGMLHRLAPETVMDAGPQHVLLLGVDARGDEPSRADTIVLTRISKSGFGLLSIPRDTRTVVPGYGADKVNHAYAYGGPELTRRSVTNLTGVNAPHHLVVRMEGVEEIVDAMGGVRVRVPQQMTRKVLGENREVTLRPGFQTLDGDEALAYVRWRGDERGDIGRVERQQDFLYQVVTQAIEPSNLTRLPKVRSAVLENVDTNMSTVELLQLGARARALKEAGAGEKWGLVPGREATLYSPQMGMDLSFWVPDEEKLRDTVKATVR